MALTIATTSVAGTLETKLRAIAAAGFDGVELHQPDLTASTMAPQELVALIKELGLRVDAFQPASEIEGLTGVARAKAFARVRYQFEVMKAIGADLLLVGASKHRDTSSDIEVIVANFIKLAEMAAAQGLRIAYLASPWATHTARDLQAYEIVMRVDRPNFGLALNSFFSLADGTRPVELAGIDGEKLFYVQLSDAPNLQGDLRFLKRQLALLPKQGVLNLQDYIRVLVRAGYSGPWAIPRLRDDYQGAAETTTRDAFRAVTSLLDEVAQTLPDASFGLVDMPPRVYPNGFEFIEFAVDENDYDALTSVLRTMRFRKEKLHHEKPVELWRQGAVLFVINRSDDGHAAQCRHAVGAGVCDMGIRVVDANQTVARARAMGAQIFDAPIGDNDLAIPAITVEGGSVIHFIDSKSDLHQVWNIEFRDMPQQEITPPAGIRRIDHISQTLRFDDMQSWLLFYLSVFEMNKSDPKDVADPFGAIKSQSVESPEGEVRLNLNGAAGTSSLAGAFLADSAAPKVQHIALYTDDIFETSARLAEAGFDRLAIPSNYYDGLSAQFELDTELVERLRAGNILYAEYGRGQFFQIYSQTIFGGFFFEIVQRANGYGGYGSKNASIRLAAQQRQQGHSK